MKGKVYVLIDPNTNKIRYVGMTKLTLKHRLGLHMSEKLTTTHKTHWINSLKKKNQSPIIKKIDNGETPEETAEKEVYWINYYLDKGEELTNHITSFAPRPYKSFLNKTAKKVIQYDLEGNKIAEFESAMAAACALGSCSDNSSIYSICNGNSNKYTYKNYVFRFDDDPFDKFKIVKKGHHICPEYHRKYLSKKAKERNKKNDREYYVMMNSLIKNRKGAKPIPVTKIDTGENFESVSQASKITGHSQTSIHRHCNNGVKKPLFKFQDIVHS